MSKTQDLIAFLQSECKNICGKSYHIEASPNAGYPRIVHEVRQIGDDSGKASYNFEVNVWAEGGSAVKQCNDLGDDIEYVFDHIHKVYDFGLVHCYATGNRQFIPDSTKNIKRLRLIFGLDVWFKGA